MSTAELWKLKRWYLGWLKEKPIFTPDEIAALDRYHKNSQDHTRKICEEGGVGFLTSLSASEMINADGSLRDNWFAVFLFFWDMYAYHKEDCVHKKLFLSRKNFVKEIGIEKVEREIRKRSFLKSFSDELVEFAKKIGDMTWT